MAFFIASILLLNKKGRYLKMIAAFLFTGLDSIRLLQALKNFHSSLS